jgi:hypothetical protein
LRDAFNPSGEIKIQQDKNDFRDKKNKNNVGSCMVFFSEIFYKIRNQTRNIKNELKQEGRIHWHGWTTFFQNIIENSESRYKNKQQQQIRHVGFGNDVEKIKKMKTYQRYQKKRHNIYKGKHDMDVHFVLTKPIGHEIRYHDNRKQTKQIIIGRG